MNLSCINTNELLSRLCNTVKQERNSTILIIRYLAELDKRQAYRDLGYSSLFSFCTEKLKYSEGATQRRISAARIINKFPIIIDYLNQVKLNLSTLSIIDEYLTDSNHLELLESVQNKSRTEVDQLLAVYLAKTNVQQSKPAAKADSIRAVNRAPKVPKETKSLPLFDLIQAEVKTDAEPIIQTPLFRHCSEFIPQFNVSFQTKQEFIELVEACKKLYGYPGIRLDEILIKIMRKQVKLALKKPKVTKATKVRTNTRYIPKSVKHQVRIRDNGQCTYVCNGTRCSCQTALQYDHIVPFSRGGSNSVDNLRLRCGTHNRLEAERMFLIPKRIVAAC